MIYLLLSLFLIINFGVLIFDFFSRLIELQYLLVRTLQQSPLCVQSEIQPSQLKALSDPDLSGNVF